MLLPFRRRLRQTVSASAPVVQLSELRTIPVLYARVVPYDAREVNHDLRIAAAHENIEYLIGIIDDLANRNGVDHPALSTGMRSDQHPRFRSRELPDSFPRELLFPRDCIEELFPRHVAS